MSEERDWVAEATAQGWVAEEDHKGEPPKGGFVDAKTFVERGESHAPFLKKRLAQMESQLNEVKQTNTEIAQHYQGILTRERADNAARIEELKQQRAEAVTAGDGQTFTKTDEEIRELESRQTNDPGNSEWDSLARQWQSDNEWYATDRTMRLFADGLSDEIRQTHRGAAYFSELTRQVKEAFPDKFSNPARNTAPAVETGGEGQAREPKPRSKEALPAEDRAQMERFIATIDGFTEEQYLENYDWDAEE